MVVQHILCSRMGRREVKPVIPKVEPPPEKNGNVDKEEESADNKNATSDDPVKKEGAEDTEKEAKTEGTTKDEEKSETDSPKQEDTKKPEEPPADSKPAETIAETTTVETKPQFIEVEEYFVKYRNFSYLHCEWRTEEEMYKGDKRIQAKLKRFKQKQQQNTNIFENVLNIYYFNLNKLLSLNNFILIYKYNVLYIHNYIIDI